MKVFSSYPPDYRLLAPTKHVICLTKPGNQEKERLGSSNLNTLVDPAHLCQSSHGQTSFLPLKYVYLTRYKLIVYLQWCARFKTRTHQIPRCLQQHSYSAHNLLNKHTLDCYDIDSLHIVH